MTKVPQIKSNDSDEETNGTQISYSKWARVEKKVPRVTVTKERYDCVKRWRESVKSIKQNFPLATSLIEG